MKSLGATALVEMLAFVFVLVGMAVTATACEGVGGPELTTLSTKLSGEGKEAETLTVLAGAKVKDKATIKGKSASSATGKVTYNVYSDNECKNLVTSAGEVAVSGESVPASSEVELEGGKTYYWQAHYGGDSKNAQSTSPCTEVLNVKALMCTLPYCEPTITPGVRLNIPLANSESRCTAGPIMTKGAEQFLLTAGHCFKETSDGIRTIVQIVRSAYPKDGVGIEREVGKNVKFSNGDTYDTAEVKIENAVWLLAGGGAPPLLVEWIAPPKVTSVVGQVTTSKVNEETCFTGVRSGTVRCGVVLRLGATHEGTPNLIEMSADGMVGDSGAPEFAPDTFGFWGGVLIQGTFVGGGEEADKGTANLTNGSKVVGGFPGGNQACTDITNWMKMWPIVPIQGTGIQPNTDVEGCEVVGVTANIKMSLPATITGKSSVTFGYPELGWYEPISQIQTAYPGQTLLTK